MSAPAPRPAAAQPPDAGDEAGRLIQEHVQTVIDQAQRSADAIEREAREEGQRAAAALEAAAREKIERASLEHLDAAQTRAAAIVHEAEEKASAIRERAREEALRARERAVHDAERAASRARARLLKYTESAEQDLAALIASLRRDAGR